MAALGSTPRELQSESRRISTSPISSVVAVSNSSSKTDARGLFGGQPLEHLRQLSSLDRDGHREVLGIVPVAPLSCRDEFVNLVG